MDAAERLNRINARGSEHADAERIRLLEAVPELARGLSREESAAATESIVAASHAIPTGKWAPHAVAEPAGALGLMLLDGFVLRAVSVGRGTGTELLGRHDLLRPWQEDAASFSESGFNVLEPARIAILDESVSAVMCRWPPVITGIVGLAMARSRSLAFQAAIMSVIGIEARLLATLWALAEKWGRVGRRGVTLELHLPQRILAQIVGSRRPTVSMALQTLKRDGLIDTDEEGRWLLHGKPPARDPVASLHLGERESPA
jgi:DNA-binding transcriptional ArsR family regulator